MNWIWIWISILIKYGNNGGRNRNLLLDEYLNKIKPYLRNIITDLQNSDAWKIQLTIVIKFISSKDAEEERVMHSSTGNIKFTSYSNANEVIKEHFESLCAKYQENFITERQNINERKSFYFWFSSVDVLKMLYSKFYTWWFIYWFSRLDKKEKSNNRSEKYKR